MTTKRYYWLKLQENFFERDEIKIIEAMPNGKDYILFYLKLMLKSINDQGRLIFKDTIPYTPDMLSTITGTNIDIVRVAVDAFIRLGLMEKLDDGALFMLEVHRLIGSETDHAQKKRDYRKRQQQEQLPDKNKTSEDNVSDNLDNIRQDIETDIEKDKPLYPLNAEGSSLGVGGAWLNCIKNNNYQFTPEQILAILEWVKYKSEKNKPMSNQQIELTLKQLNEYHLARHNIIYMIERSISMGYKAIMEPTSKSIVYNAPSSAASDKAADEEYFKPETHLEKIKLRNYLERCYMINKVDPRTKQALTPEQKEVLKKHIAHSKRIGISITDYIYRYEVSQGECLLEQLI